MTAITGFQATTTDERRVQVDAYGNNAAFACLHCHAPCLAILREHQRGSSQERPTACPSCSSAYWLQVNEVRKLLVIHEVEFDRLAAGEFPRVIGRPTKDAGTYKLGKEPSSLASHNQVSWDVIAAILKAYGSADYFDLAVAVRQHKHGDKAASGPQSFVSYCIRSGWLVRG